MPRALNIVLLSEVSADKVIGGAERMLREQALGLCGIGHRVTLVVRAPTGDSPEHVAIGPVPEHRYRPWRAGEPAFVLSSIVGSTRSFDRALEGRSSADGIDAAVIHQSLAGLGPLLLRRNRARTWIYMCLSLAHEEYMTRRPPGSNPVDRMRGALNARFRRLTERAVMRRCDRVVVMSEFMWRRVVTTHGIPESKLRLVPGAAALDAFAPSADRAATRRRLNLPADKTILFAVRNLVPRMGLDNVLHAMAELREERDLLLLIGGEGPLRGTLESLIEKLDLTGRVRLLGFIPEPDLPKFYQTADMVLMPTLQLEGFGLVTVEALACGTPVLGTPVGAIPEVLTKIDPQLVTDGVEGPSLAKGIRAMLRRFREQPDEKTRLSRRCREVVERDYTWERHRRDLERVLLEACSTQAGDPMRADQGGHPTPQRAAR